MGRVVGGEFRVGNSCTPVVDSCQCMAKPIQYCKVKKLNFKKKERSEQLVQIETVRLDIMGTRLHVVSGKPIGHSRDLRCLAELVVRRVRQILL